MSLNKHSKESKTSSCMSGLLKGLGLKKTDKIVIACFPKSASTFTFNVIMELTGYPFHALFYKATYMEQNLYLPAVKKFKRKDFVSQMHMPGVEHNIEMLKKYNFKTIVLVRNIFDVVISMFDHLEKAHIGVPVGYLNEEYYKFPDETKIDLIVDLLIPWYFKFYSSWFDAERKKLIDFKWSTYEKMKKDDVSFIKEILDYCNIEKSNKEIKDAIEKVKSGVNIRISKGVAGRGEQMLNEEQKERIIKYASYYPWVNFERIGIIK